MTATTFAPRVASPGSSSGGWRRQGPAAAEFGLWLMAAAFIHFLVLSLVFPRVYDPLWPNHSDYYIPSEMAHTPGALLALLHLPRPVGYLFFYLTGFLGTRGAMACDLVLVFVNCALTVMLVRRVAGLPRTRAFAAAAAAFLYLVFAHPAQYVWSTYDVFSQLSYLLLLAALVLGWNERAWVIQTAVFTLAFLAKETYVLSLFLLLGAWWLGAEGPRRSAVLRTALAAAVSFALALVYSALVGSEYLGGGAAGDPYRIDFVPASILRQWWLFAAESGPALWALAAASAVAAAASASRLPREHRLSLLVLPLAGLVAWLPNALLPNHHMAGYSWNGAFLLLAPILLAPLLWRPGHKVWLSILLAWAFLTPVALGASYSKNNWVLEQQHRQKVMMTSIKDAFAHLPATVRTVRVSGLDYPFSPFDHPRSLYEYSPRLLTYDVVIYEPKSFTRIQQPSPARWSFPDASRRFAADQTWMFNEDGSTTRAQISADDLQSVRALGLDPADLALFPAVTTALTASQAGKLDLDGYHLLACGAAYIAYRQYVPALACLKPSASKIPDNPYPYFYRAVAEENTGHPAEAKTDFAQAIAHDDPAHPNPAFKAGLQRVQASATSSSSAH